MLRNPGIFNFLDGYAISIPNHQPDKPPTGLMLVAPSNFDQKLLQIAKIIEEYLS